MGTFQALPATIAFVMHRQGINQSELARRSGLLPAQVSRYLSGEVRPQGQQIERIARGLDLQVSTFFLIAEQMVQLQQFVEYRPAGMRLRTQDPLFHKLLEMALEARAALAGGEGEDLLPLTALTPGTDCADAPITEGDAMSPVREATQHDVLEMLFEAQRLIQEGHRLTLEALQQLALPPAGS